MPKCNKSLINRGKFVMMPAVRDVLLKTGGPLLEQVDIHNPVGLSLLLVEELPISPYFETLFKPNYLCSFEDFSVSHFLNYCYYFAFI